MKIHDKVFRYFKTYQKSFPVMEGNKSGWFAMFVEMVRRRFFKRKPGRRDSEIVNDPAEILEMWQVYKLMVYSLELFPKLFEFSRMIGVARGTFFNWETGKTRNKTSIYLDITKRIMSDIEADLLARAVECNSRGAIFILKAKFHYDDRGGGFMFNVINKQDPVIAPDVIEQVEQMIGMENAGKD